MDDDSNFAEVVDTSAEGEVEAASAVEAGNNDSMLLVDDDFDSAADEEELDDGGVEEIQDPGSSEDSGDLSAADEEVEKLAPDGSRSSAANKIDSGEIKNSSGRNESEMALNCSVEEVDSCSILDDTAEEVRPDVQASGGGAATADVSAEAERPHVVPTNREEVLRQHPGVFVMETEVVTGRPAVAAEADLPDMDNKRFLESLPCTERLRASSRDGSLLSGDGKSEAGENLSDRESVVSGVVTRNLRRKETKKTQAKVNSKSRVKKAPGLTTRAGKGRGRRTLMKRKPVKSIRNPPTPVTADRVYYRGEFYSVGDIVSVTDIGGDIFYAQLRGFLTDEYGEKSGVISWLLPTTGSPPPNEGFHPATYVIGPEEDVPRSLSVFTFVMHAPSDYYYYRNAPYRTATRPSSSSSFTSLRLGPRLRIVNEKSVFVGV